MEAALSALRRLHEIVRRLRGPDGCPWDREQTLERMGPNLLEEASEVIDAIEDADGRPSASVCEELGDLLMNILLCAEIAREEDAFSLEDVARGISEKLVRRHPHVFGDVRLEGVDDVLAQWNRIKAEETKQRAGVAPADGVGAAGEEAGSSRLDRVPRSLPVLERAHEIGRVAARAGFDWSGPEGVLAKVREELGEVEALLGPGGGIRGAPGEDHRRQEALEDELGDLLFAVVSLCRKLQTRPERALRRTLKKFAFRFRYIEERVSDFEEASLEELERLWREARRRESSPSGRSGTGGRS